MTRRAGVYAILALTLLAAQSASATPHPGYRIPPDNPFVATASARPEVYAYGLRNPYRWSFDQPTGDLYLADVGGNLREEIDYLPRADIAGANFGWNCFEGTRVQKGCRLSNYFPPVWEYPSSPDVVIGGYLVHAPDLPSFQGRYLYGQYLTGLYTLGPGGAGPAVNVSAGIVGVTSLGEDGVGHLYASSFDGPLYRLGESVGALTLTEIGRFDHPTQVLSPPGDASRLFVVEKRGTVAASGACCARAVGFGSARATTDCCRPRRRRAHAGRDARPTSQRLSSRRRRSRNARSAGFATSSLARR